jgi:hypothetical protein
MYRRNLDIFVAGGTGLLGGAAYLAHVPGQVQVILGIALFFAPGYLWSEAILSQRLPALERVITSAGLALIFPIIGGFLFYGLRIPLFRSAWVGLLVVLTLLGVVAVAVQRLRQPAAAPRQNAGPRPQSGHGRLSPLNGLIFGLAGVIALGSVAYSVHSAKAQKQPATTALGMTAVVVGETADGTVLTDPSKANLDVTNHQGVTAQYELKLYRKGKLSDTWPLTLADGQTWQKVIPYTVAQGDGILADLYLLPNTTKPYEFADNGQVTNPS